MLGQCQWLEIISNCQWFATKVRATRWVLKNQINICMFVAFNVLVNKRTLERIRNYLQCRGKKKKLWDKPLELGSRLLLQVIMAIDKTSNPNQVLSLDTLSLTEAPPLSLSIWGKDRSCTPLALATGATSTTFSPFLPTAIILLMRLQHSTTKPLQSFANWIANSFTYSRVSNDNPRPPDPQRCTRSPWLRSV